MAENKKSFVLYSDLLPTLEKMSDQDAGLLFKHILKYVNDHNPEPENLIIDLVFEPIKQQLKRDLKAYQNKREQNKLNAQKRWQAKNANASVGKNGNANDAVNGNDNVSVSVSVNDNGNVSDNDILLEKETKDIIVDTSEKKAKETSDIKTEESFQKKIAPKKRFSIPSVEEIFLYCQERNNAVDPQHFFDFYSSKDWMIGKNKMKDWKAAVRTWERNSNNKQNQNQNAKQSEQRFVGRQSRETIEHNLATGYESAERIRKQLLGNPD